MDVKCRFRGESNIGVLVCLGFRILNKQNAAYLHLYSICIFDSSLWAFIQLEIFWSIRWFSKLFSGAKYVKCNVHTNHNTMIDGQHVMMVNDISIGRELWGYFKQLLRIIWLCLLGSCWIFNGNCRHDSRKTHRWTTFGISTSSHPPYYCGILSQNKLVCSEENHRPHPESLN